MSVTVTDHNGRVAPDLSVSFSSTYGTFSDALVTTDANGQATATLINPRSEGNAELNLQIGHAGRVKQAYVVDYPTAQLLDINARNAMIVADQARAGHLEHERFDGTNIGLDYKVEKAVRVLGAPGETVNIALGDLQDPNIEPLAAFYMNDLDTASDGTQIAEEETGLHNATAKYVTVARDNPMGKGTSYFFSKGNFDVETNGPMDSHLQVTNHSALNSADNLGFRLDFKADDTDATLFNHNGAHVLRYNANGEIEYQIQTDTGTYTLTSGVLPIAQWHTVAGRYYNGQLELEVNGQAVTPIPASGTLQYSGSSGIRIADNYQGFMNSLRFYNWNAQPLTRLPNGQQSMAVTVGVEGYTDVMVTGTGQLNQQQTGSATQLLRVAIKGQLSREYISLLSSNAYQQLASQYMNTLYADAPPINITQTFNPQPYQGIAGLNFLIPTAQAGVFDFTLDDLYDGLSGAVNFLIPFESFGILVDQLTYLAKGDPNFNATELTFAALDLVTVIPIAKPLKPLLKPIKNFVKKYGDKAIIKAMAGVLGDAAEQAISSRKFDKFVSLLPYLLIVGEILNDPDGLESIEFMIDAIESTDDLWAWINYFNLPEGDWVGTDIPEVDLSSTEYDFNPLSLFISKAYAGPTVNRVKGAVVVKILKRLRLDPDIEPKEMTKVVRTMVDQIKNERWLRGFVFDGNTIASAAHIFRVAGTNAVRRLFNKNSNDRVSKKLVIASIVYLFEQMASNNLDDRLTLKILTKVGLGLSGPDTEIAENARHGHLFHLAQLALLQFENQHLGGKPIRDIEAVRETVFYVKQGVAAQGNGGRYKRTVDTVLGSAGDEVWVELKSKKTPLKNGDFKLWNYKNKRGGIHKELTADMVALLHKRGDLQFANVEAAGVKWYFHKFRTSNGKSNPSETEIKSKMREMCRNLVKAPSKPKSKATFGISENAITSGCENLIISRDIGQLADVESLIIRFAENNLFEDFLANPERE